MEVLLGDGDEFLFYFLASGVLDLEVYTVFVEET
jgi:hypothetical protein